ncbi:MAG: radical SAM protein [Candidatus Omnitrophota bacterium]
MPKVKEFIFSITNRCNLKCKMCDIPRIALEELSTAEAKRVISDAARLGFSTFVFSGGEPLLRNDIFELIAFAQGQRLNVCLTSNGSLIDEKTAQQLACARIGVVNVSIDGPEHVHDALRGEGVFEQAVRALGHLRKHGVETTVATMVCRENYRDLAHIVNLARSCKVTTIKFQPFSAIFIQGQQRESSFMLSPQELPEATAIVEQVIALCKQYAIATNPESYLRRIPFYLNGKKLPSQKGCSALWTTCCINSKGDIFPCWVFNNAQMRIGSLKETSLGALWDCRRHRQIRQIIQENGCPGCLMSCYDEGYGEQRPPFFILRKTQKIKEAKTYQKIINRFIQNFKGEIAGLQSSYRFYKSFRGSPNNLFQRLKKKLKRRRAARNDGTARDTEELHQEINAAKATLKKEMNTLR